MLDQEYCSTKKMSTTFACRLLLLVISVAALRLSAAAAACLPDERSALLNFKRLAVLNDPSNFWLPDWTSNSSDYDCCRWSGISCDTEGHVTAIERNNCGEDPTDQAILQRSHKNALRAELTPEAMEALAAGVSRLATLDLGCQLFSGAIPPNIANLKSLVFLDLSFQAQQRYLETEILTGPLPEELWSLPSLQHLDLGYNSFTGSLSPHIANASSLVALFLGTNNFTGELPASLQNLTHLQNLDVSSNINLNSLPNGGGDWQPQFQLRTLDVSLCSFGGAFPTWLRSQTNLSSLSLAGNKLSGDIPHWAWHLASHYLDLSENQFSYTFSCSSAAPPPPPSLSSLDVSYNFHIGGSFPCFVADLTALQTLSFAGNAIAGPIPDSTFRNLTHLDTLDLSGNLFDGLLPSSLRYLSSLSNADLDSNPFAAQELPLFLLTLPSLVRIDLSFCNLTAVSFNGNGSSSLEYLKLTGNQLTGAVPEQISFFFPKLKYLRLDLNRLTGAVPASFATLSQLETLDLSGNELGGPLPEELRNLTKLVVLNLNGNRVGGSVPSFVRWLGELLMLDMGSNDLVGEIPDWLGTSLEQLQILILADNDLNGVIPSSLGLLDGIISPASGTSATSVETHDDYIEDDANITLKGQTNTYAYLQRLTLIDLSGNRLSGSIPSKLGDLHGLISLDLSRNRLTGPIPAALGGLLELESLDLSQNQLSGQIPESFDNLRKLGFVNLSVNQLYGRIPVAVQWDTFNTSSFLDNRGLCVESRSFLADLPLCDEDEEVDEEDREDDAQKTGAEEGEGFIEWKGYAVGFPAGVALGLVVAAAWFDGCGSGGVEDREEEEEKRKKGVQFMTSSSGSSRDEEDDGKKKREGGATTVDWQAVFASIQNKMNLTDPVLLATAGK